MPLDYNQIFQNFLTISIIGIIGYLIWRGMPESKIKQGLRDLFGKLKPEK